MSKSKNRMSAVIKTAFILLSALALITRGREVSDGVLNGIRFCAGELVPSLFPFIFLAAFTAKSGFIGKIGRIMNTPGRILFGLSGSSTTAVILSALGGYPVGAKMIESLTEKGEISRDEASRAACVAVGAGAGFVVSFAGIRLLGSAEIGMCIMSAQFFSVIILGLLNKLIYRSEPRYEHINKGTSPCPFSHVFCDSVSSALYSTLEMCAMVVLFSAAENTLCAVLSDDRLSRLLSVLLEVTSSCRKLGQDRSVILMAFALGFGGLCVHFQIFRILGKIRINKPIFFIFRIMQGLICAALTYLFIRLFNVSLPVFSSAESFSAIPGTSALGSVLLVLTSVFFSLYC